MKELLRQTPAAEKWTAARRPRCLLLGVLTLIGLALLPVCLSPARAADPYDKSLEARVAALERELNLINGDTKGKNPQDDGPRVPTFMRAAGSSVQQLTIGGDLRFRYAWDNEQFQLPGAGSLQRSRYLFRLRLNLNWTLDEHWFAAVGFTTNGAADTGNQTATEGFDDYGIYLHQFVVGWKASDFLTVQAGKIFVPFYNNSEGLLNWSNINPTGLTESLEFNPTTRLNLKANFGQYLFYDNPESGYAVTPVTVVTATGGKAGTATANVYTVNPAGTVPKTRKNDAVLFYQDLVATYKPGDLFTVIVSPAFYFYAPHGSVGISGNALGPIGRANASDVNNANPLAPTQAALLGSADFNSDDATRCLYVGLLDGEVQFPAGLVKGKLYGDFAYNFEGGQRAHEILGLAEGSFKDKQSWIAGVQIGEPKRKGDWYASAEYHQVGVASIDPNLNDTNFGLSRLNTQGIRLAVGYNFQTWLRGEVWYYGAWNLEKNLHDLRGNRLTATNTRSFYDENASQNLIIQMTAGF